MPNWAHPEQIWSQLWSPHPTEEEIAKQGFATEPVFIAMISPVDSVWPAVEDVLDDISTPKRRLARSSSTVSRPDSSSTVSRQSVPAGVAVPKYMLCAAPNLMIQSERLCGRAHLFNSLGIPLWEGDLVNGYPELKGSPANVSHRAVDIHTGSAAVAFAGVSKYHVCSLADVVESPDFGLTVLALCAWRLAYPFAESSDDDSPNVIVTLLPLPLLIAQWGLIVSVFYQSVKDCTHVVLHIGCEHPFV